MKKSMIAFSIFISLVIVITFSLSYLKRNSQKFEKKCDQLEDLIVQEQWEEAYNSSVKLFEQWQKESSKFSIFVHHSEIDNINNEAFKLIIYVKCQDKTESLASLHSMKLFLQHIYDIEKVNLQNVL